MPTLLITGASGFIGSFLVEEGLRRNFTVYAGIRRSSSREYLQDPAIQFIEFDFSSVENVAATLEAYKQRGVHFDYIIHNAGVTKSQKKGDFHRVNVLNTKNFITALEQTGMIPRKFVFISSLAAYGPGDPKTMQPVMLNDPPKPIELYGKSKLEAEKFIQTLSHFPWLIIRPTGVYGPREKDYYVFFQTMNCGFETYIGSGKQILTFIYVKDLVRLVLDAATSPIYRKAYFASDGKEYDTVEFATITKKHLGKKTVKLVIPAGIVKYLASGLESVFALWGQTPTLNRDKYSVLASKNWRCETTPLQSELGFTADYDLDKGVSETIQWYKTHGWL